MLRSGRSSVPRISACAAVAISAVAVVSTAQAGTVTVRAVPAYPGDSSYQTNEVYYRAAPGERNDVVVAYPADALSVTITDRSAVVTATGTCSAVDAHTAICRALEFPTGGPYLQRTRVDLSDRDDYVTTTRPTPYPIGGVIANGGPGDDRLVGAAGDDILNGGGGRDKLYGGPDFDTLTDGDRDDGRGAAAPDADTLDGGPDDDTIDYRDRNRAIAIRLHGHTRGGALGERDRLSGFENALGGAGDDHLVGTGTANRLSGGAGDDTILGLGGGSKQSWSDRLEGNSGADSLIGGAGPDSLEGGAGADRLSCGRNADVVRGAELRELIPTSCEDLAYAFGPYNEDHLSVPAHPITVSSRAVTFLLACPSFVLNEGEPSPCSGDLSLRSLGGPRRLIGRGTFRHGASGGTFEVRVGLSHFGRFAARRRHGAVAAARIRLRSPRDLKVGWGVRVQAAD